MKIHVNVGALGNSMRFMLTGGQRYDILRAEALIADADIFLLVIAGKEAIAVIRLVKTAMKAKNLKNISTKGLIWRGCFVGKIKHY
ncbi:MAG: hypothetical protein HN921_14245 [Bacteroidetes bacterium]|jgi:hypothetical protein|nr:hypothetical protein [Bacteroidota bacterium]